MAVIKMSMKDYAAYSQRLGKQLLPAVRRGIIKGAGASIALVLKPATAQAVPASARGSVGATDTLKYMRAWKVRPLPNGALIYNDAPYAGIIEYGRRPGARPPPSDVLIPWIRNKIPIQVKQSKRKAGPARLRKSKRSVDEAKALAFVVARAIGKRGLRGRYVLAKALPKIKQLIRQHVQDYLYVIVNAARGGGVD